MMAQSAGGLGAVGRRSRYLRTGGGGKVLRQSPKIGRPWLASLSS
jgi:hypothetical protein